MFTAPKSKNDCVLTAISNLTGIPYEKVWQAREDCNGVVIGGKMPGGTFTNKVPSIYHLLGFRVVETNGLPSFNTPCLFRFTNGPRSKCGHMVAVIEGMAIENDGSSWPMNSRRMWQRKCYYLYPLNQ